MGASCTRLAGGKEPVMREGITEGAMSWKKQGVSVWCGENSVVCECGQ